MHARWKTSFSPPGHAAGRQTSVRRSRWSSPQGSSEKGIHIRLLMRPCLAGMALTVAMLYITGWQLAHPTQGTSSPIVGGDHRAAHGRVDAAKQGLQHNQEIDWRTKVTLYQVPRAVAEEVNKNSNDHTISNIDVSSTQGLFDEVDVMALTGAISRYATFARRTLAADKLALEQFKPLQGKYIVLKTGNELANRLRGVLSGLLLGILTDRVFVADITYQKDARQGLLSTLFEGPGYQWDLSLLPDGLRRALATSRGRMVEFDMREDDFRRWVCEDVLRSEELSAAPIITLSTVVYPLPLLARNPTYASHAIFAAGFIPESTWPLYQPLGEEHQDDPVVREVGGGGAGVETKELMQWKGFAGGKQSRIEAFETLLTRMVLRPTVEMRDRARVMEQLVRDRAAAWGEKRGMKTPPRVVGLHLRTYYVNAISPGSLENNLREFASCTSTRETGVDDTFYFVATDEARTQAVAQKVWGDGCFFQKFGLTGGFQEGMKSALVDLLVMGSLDDFVITPHSSFSELGSTLSFTWLSDYQTALRILPNRPLMPIFAHMNEFERRKVMSLLDRRAAPIKSRSTGQGQAGQQCLRQYAAGMSVVVARGQYLRSMFETIENAECMRKRRVEIAEV